MKLEPKNVSIVGAIMVTAASVATAAYEAWCAKKRTKLYETYMASCKPVGMTAETANNITIVNGEEETEEKTNVD